MKTMSSRSLVSSRSQQPPVPADLHTRLVLASSQVRTCDNVISVPTAPRACRPTRAPRARPHLRQRHLGPNSPPCLQTYTRASCSSPPATTSSRSTAHKSGTQVGHTSRVGSNRLSELACFPSHVGTCDNVISVPTAPRACRHTSASCSHVSPRRSGLAQSSPDIV